MKEVFRNPEKLEDFLLIIHIMAGVLSLFLGLIIFTLKKGDKRHKNLGYGYFLGMTVAVITAIPLGVWSRNLFLVLIAVFSYFFVLTGVRSVRHKTRANMSTMDSLLVVLFAATFLAMIALGAYTGMTQDDGPWLILMVFGGIGLLAARTDLLLVFTNKEPDQLHWLQSHLGKMSGSYIAATTAFLVNNLHNVPELVVWLGPTVIGTLLITLAARKYKKQFATFEEEED